MLLGELKFAHLYKCTYGMTCENTANFSVAIQFPFANLPNLSTYQFFSFWY